MDPSSRGGNLRKGGGWCSSSWAPQGRQYSRHLALSSNLSLASSFCLAKWRIGVGGEAVASSAGLWKGSAVVARSEQQCPRVQETLGKASPPYFLEA